ncbi:DUF547 domain-containing protein [Algicella marina]|nr:DUF547 domain-containing protein [Algicella marina]
MGITGLLLFSANSRAFSAPAARLIDERWRKFGSEPDPDHSAWAAVLRDHVRLSKDGIARFAYRDAKQSQVASYIVALSSIDPSRLTSASAFAFWVNLYNAATIETVLAAYPVKSIRDIGGGLFTSGPWQEKRLRVAGQDLSLDDIEHGILRPVWGDARVHYAVNCASLGCPNLADRPWSADRLGSMLQAGAWAYINHPRGMTLQDGRLVVSSLYDWYKQDFGGTDAGVLAHFRKYLEPGRLSAVEKVDKIAAYRYDWSLNDA